MKNDPQWWKTCKYALLTKGVLSLVKMESSFFASKGPLSPTLMEISPDKRYSRPQLAQRILTITS